MTRVVFDANIWISHFLKNMSGEIQTMLDCEEVRLLRSPLLTTELRDVLSRPKFDKYLTGSRSDYLLVYELSTTPFNTIPVFEDCPDPKDNYLFDLAIQAKADYLVTGDKVVLSTPVPSPLKVITLTEFKTMFSGNAEQP
jgi:putative PIN family toxin of toxin-antitoxin system